MAVAVVVAAAATTPPSKQDKSLSDFRAVLTSASGRSLPMGVIRLPCGQLEVVGAALSAEPHTLHVSYGGAAVRFSPRQVHVHPAPLDVRHLDTHIDASEAGRIGVSMTSRDVYGNETGAKLVCAAILPNWAISKDSMKAEALCERIEDLVPAAADAAIDVTDGGGGRGGGATPRAGTLESETRLIAAIFGARERRRRRRRRG